jgi:hypothetical protein
MLQGCLSGLFTTTIVEMISRRDRRKEAWTVEWLTGALASKDPFELVMADDGEAVYARIANAVLASYPEPAGATDDGFAATVREAAATSGVAPYAIDDVSIGALVRILRREARYAKEA